MKLGAGVAPVIRLLAAGVRVGIGTDGCASNNNLDLFREMGITAKLHKAVSGDPTVLDAQTVIQMATLDGAAAIGLEDQIGSLETGKAADLIILNRRRPHLTPMYRPESHIVYAAKASDVETVVIGGRIVVENRKVLTMDTTEILQTAGHLSREIDISRGTTHTGGMK
jgi:5-methylthioadenosine/S-adenosylhomocysteine deaminase